MQALVVEFRIKPEYIDAFAKAIGINAAASLAQEPGCMVFDVCRDPADPAVFFLYELYDTEAAVQAHLQSPHFLQMNDATAAWVTHKSVRRLVRT
jgi:(4S)-4-hydroxy-5-phosphonooxypentane-2,3-dione isomerase